jgi:hypothetical protein
MTIPENFVNLNDLTVSIDLKAMSTALAAEIVQSFSLGGTDCGTASFYALQRTIQSVLTDQFAKIKEPDVVTL